MRLAVMLLAVAAVGCGKPKVKTMHFTSGHAVYCTAESPENAWVEKGNICHADPADRVPVR